MAGSSSDDDMIVGINITPLVDVVLVLLVIFLVTAPVMYQSAIQIKLPKAASGGGKDPSKNVQQLALSSEGRVDWNGKALSMETLEVEVRARAAQLREQTIYVSADERVPHGMVVRLMDVFRQSGITQFGFNVEAAKPR